MVADKPSGVPDKIFRFFKLTLSGYILSGFQQLVYRRLIASEYIVQIA